jgi:hypothetical protein
MKSVWDWLITPPASSDVLTPLSAAYLGVFLIGFVASAYRPRGDGCPAAEADSTDGRDLPCARIGLWIFGAGLVFFAVRALQIDPFLLAAPIWMVAAVIALLVAGWRCFDARRRN